MAGSHLLPDMVRAAFPWHVAGRPAFLALYDSAATIELVTARAGQPDRGQDNDKAGTQSLLGSGPRQSQQRGPASAPRQLRTPGKTAIVDQCGSREEPRAHPDTSVGPQAPGKRRGAKTVEGNARLARSEVAELKIQRGAGIVSVGGARLAASLAENDLIDEYRLFVSPVVLGAAPRTSRHCRRHSTSNSSRRRPSRRSSTSGTGGASPPREVARFHRPVRIDAKLQRCTDGRTRLAEVWCAAPTGSQSRTEPAAVNWPVPLLLRLLSWRLKRLKPTRCCTLRRYRHPAPPNLRTPLRPAGQPGALTPCVTGRRRALDVRQDGRSPPAAPFAPGSYRIRPSGSHSATCSRSSRSRRSGRTRPPSRHRGR
jgi:hypothetical protein